MTDVALAIELACPGPLAATPADRDPLIDGGQ